MSSPGGDPRRSALEAAAVWRLILTEAGVETRPDLEAWLAAAPANLEAWREIQSAWAAMDGLAGAPELSGVRRAALERRPRGRSAWRLFAAAAALALAVPASYSAVGLMRSTEVLSTPRTERRLATLEDGTRVTLDAGTKIRVRLQAHRRDVDLLHGQARFEVAHDAKRPFRVRAGDQSVTALGTIFTVDRRPESVVVTLLQGRVLVAADQAGTSAGVQQTTILAPGQRLEATIRAHSTRLSPPVAPPKVAPVTLAQATAWEAGRLVFDDEPLGEVAQRVSRYSLQSIVVADPAAADLRVSGTFKAGDGEAFVEAVTAYFPLQAKVSGRAIILSSADRKNRQSHVGN